MVYDLGGGTLDVSLLRMETGKVRVIGTSGDTHLGGEDFDQKLVEYGVKDFKNKTGLDISEQKKALLTLKNYLQRIKRMLSTELEADIDLESLYQDEDYTTTMTRPQFEEICKDVFARCLAPVEKVLQDAGVGRGDVDEVILVGGSTRIPKVKKLLSEYFGNK